MTHRKYRLRFTLASAFGVIAIAALPATAQTVPATGQMTASANVTANCTFTTTPLGFGDTDVTDGKLHEGTATISVLCTNGTTWTASADKGQGGADATMALRKMSFGTDSLNYILYTDLAKTAIWGDATTGTATISRTGSGAAQSLSLAGTIPAGQVSAPKGLYADTIAVTVTY